MGQVRALLVGANLGDQACRPKADSSLLHPSRRKARRLGTPATVGMTIFVHTRSGPPRAAVSRSRAVHSGSISTRQYGTECSVDMVHGENSLRRGAFVERVGVKLPRLLHPIAPKTGSLGTPVRSGFRRRAQTPAERLNFDCASRLSRCAQDDMEVSWWAGAQVCALHWEVKGIAEHGQHNRDSFRQTSRQDIALPAIPR